MTLSSRAFTLTLAGEADTIRLGQDLALALKPGDCLALSGNLDAAVTYEPYLSLVRDKPETGKLIADSKQYPMGFDTFGCTPKFLKENPKAAKALTESYFEALEMISKEPNKSFGIMGANVK